MKKLFKICLFVGILMLALTIKSEASEVTGHVNNSTNSYDYTYGELQSNGNMLVTIVFENEVPADVRSYFTTNGEFSFASDNKTMTKTYTQVDSRPAAEYFEYANLTIITPFIMQVGDIRTITSSEATVTSTSDASIVEISTTSNSYTAKAPGRAEVTITANYAGSSTPVTYVLTVFVEGSSTPSDPDNTTTPAGATDFSNFKLSFRDTTKYSSVTADYSGVTKAQGHVYKFYISDYSTGSSALAPENYASFSKDADGNDVIIFTGASARELTEFTGDKYLHIIDSYYANSTQQVNITDKKLTDAVKVSTPVGSRIDVYLYDATKTYFHNLIGASSDRKVSYKVGRVTSNDVLRAFKNDESSGFTKLLSYAKSDSSPLKTGSFEMPSEISGTLSSNLINDINITRDAYYYVYLALETDDGQYVETEDVQIYRGITPGLNGEIVHFAYGSIEVPDDTNTSDGTKANTVLPATGEAALIIGLIGAAIVGIVIFRKKASKF